jgi:hypothetical protein
MCASGTHLGCFCTFVEIATVKTTPHDGFVSLEYPVSLDIGRQIQIPFLMLLFGNSYGLEYLRYALEALLSGNLGKARIHLRPFMMLAAGGCLEVFQGCPYNSGRESGRSACSFSWFAVSSKIFEIWT